MKINSIIDLVKDLDTSRQTKNLNKLLIRILLHLQVEFSTENSDAELKTTTIKLLPEIGYELDENWSIGTVVGYQYSKTGDLKTNTFTIAPYARYSFLQSDLIKLFVDGGFGFSTAKVKGSDAANSWNIGLKPGLAIKLSDRFCLVAKYGFLGYSQDETPMGTKTKNFGLDLDTDELSFGFHYIF